MFSIYFLLFLLLLFLHSREKEKERAVVPFRLLLLYFTNIDLILSSVFSDPYVKIELVNITSNGGDDVVDCVLTKKKKKVMICLPPFQEKHLL